MSAANPFAQGACLLGLLPTVIFLGVYYTVADVVLLLQVFVYRETRAEEIVAGDESDSGGDDPAVRAPLLEPHGDECDQEPGLLATPQPQQFQLSRVVTAVALALAPLLLVWYTQIDPTAYYYTAIVLGWVSALLYVGSRVPQIALNHRLKSCQGISIAMFAFSVLGNATYSLVSE